jgi:hypothetical protein
MAPEPISTAYSKNPTSQSMCLYLYLSLLGNGSLKNLTATTNTHATIEEFLGASISYSVRVVSNERRRSVLARTSYFYVESGGTHSYHCAVSI